MRRITKELEERREVLLEKERSVAPLCLRLMNNTTLSLILNLSSASFGRAGPFSSLFSCSLHTFVACLLTFVLRFLVDEKVNNVLRRNPEWAALIQKQLDNLQYRDVEKGTHFEEN